MWIAPGISGIEEIKEIHDAHYGVRWDMSRPSLHFCVKGDFGSALQIITDETEIDIILKSWKGVEKAEDLNGLKCSCYATSYLDKRIIFKQIISYGEIRLIKEGKKSEN